jgi:hypothetical protein
MLNWGYKGFDIAMEQHSWSHVGFIFFSIVSFFDSSKIYVGATLLK